MRHPDANMKMPSTASDLMRIIERSKHAALWALGTIPAEPGDEQAMRVAFWLAGDDPEDAVVAFEYGRLIVTLDSSYHFDLSRLHQDYPEWSWKRQIAGKCWCKPEHLALLDTLCELIPPANAPSPAEVMT